MLRFLITILLVLLGVALQFIFPVDAAPTCYRIDIAVTNLSARPVGFIPTFFDADTHAPAQYGTEVIVPPGQTLTGSLESAFEENSTDGGFYYWFDDVESSTDFPVSNVDFTHTFALSACDSTGLSDSPLHLATLAAPSVIYDGHAVHGKGTLAPSLTSPEIPTVQDSCALSNTSRLVIEGNNRTPSMIPQPCNDV